MATKTKKTTIKGNKTTKVVKKINNDLVNASIAAINTTISNGEKWQKLAAKLVKESETVREQQISMFFDTAETLKKQLNSGAKKMKHLVGYNPEVLENAKDLVTNNPVSRKVIEIAEDVSTMVSENPMVKKAEKTTAEIKAKGMAKFNEVKEDVLEQASKIIDKGEAMIEEAKTSPKAKRTPKAKTTKVVTKRAAKKVVAKKATAKKTVAKKATTSKKVVAKKATTPKKVVAKKATTTKKVIAKAAPKKTVAKKATATKAKATKVVAKATPKSTATIAKKAVVVKNENVAKATDIKKAVTAKVDNVKTDAKK